MLNVNKLNLGKGVAVFLALMFLGLGLFSPASAEEAPKTKNFKKGPRPVGMINSSNGGVYKKGDLGAIFKYIYFNQDQMYDGNHKIDFERPKKGQKPGKKCSEKRLNKYQLTLRAGLFEDFDARFVIPYFEKHLERKSFKDDFTDNHSGIGDVKLIGRYGIFAQRKKDPLNLAVGLGVQLPTGTTDGEDSFGKCPGFLQTGSGSVDPLFEVGAHKIMGRHWLSSHLMYHLTTKGEKGDQDFEKPDTFKYSAGYAYALNEWFDLQMELNGVVKSKAKLEGQKVDGTGGHVVYVTPGVHFKFYKKMHFDVGVPVPVYRNLNGKQLSEDFRVIGKLALRF
jgi:hypothetical protein